MSRQRMLSVPLLGLCLSATAIATAPASAQTFRLTMNGLLDDRSSISGATVTPLANASPFTLTAIFNSSSPNLVAPIGIPGFVSYTPSSIQLDIAGQSYSVLPFSFATPTGLSVSIFDATTPFGPPGRYGVGVIQNPLADGAGIIADFTGAAPPFIIGSTGIVSTTFTGFSGVGVSSGVCIVGTPDNCQTHAVTPIPLMLGAESYSLILGSYEANAAPGFSYSVSITAVPEPASLALVAVGLTGVAVATRRRRRQTTV